MDTLASLMAGGTDTVALTNDGTGNFGGSDLATDNGTAITVSTNGGTCGSGSAICFTLKKANFNGIDQMQIGSTTMVTSGASSGFTVIGPLPTATYPGNVTCTPSSGGSACTTIYTSANDATSTCSIEENGPVKAAVKCTYTHNDGSGHTYLNGTARLFFYKGESFANVTAVVRNATYAASGVFDSAFKGHRGYELRLTPNISGTLTYNISNHTGTPTSGTLSGSNGAYLYEGNSLSLKPANWCDNGFCVPRHSTLATASSPRRRGRFLGALVPSRPLPLDPQRS